MHGLAVITIEGIGSTKTKLHPVQERIAKAHGSQCGFCTPGIVMSMYTLLRNSPKPTMKEMEVAFQGNLCRCTGYRPIIEGYRTFTEEWERSRINGNGISNGNGCAMGDQCCKKQKINRDQEELFDPSEFIPYDESQEPIFPPELKLTDTYDKQYLYIRGKNVTWYRPRTLNELLALKQQYPHAKLLVGNTEIGVEVKFKNCNYPIIIHVSQVQELLITKELCRGVQIGAGVTLDELEAFLKDQINKLPDFKTQIYKSIVDMLHWFASKQIRSVGAIGGNIMTGSPISDLIPILMATKVNMEVASEAKGKRIVSLNEKFFTGYRKNVIGDNEVLLSLSIPFTHQNQYVYAYKQARRREDDIAIVNMAVQIGIKNRTDIIDSISFGIGGMAPSVVTAPITQARLRGLPWNRDTLEIAYKSLLEDLPLDPDAPGGMITYRKSLALSLFFRCFLTMCKNLSVKIDPRELSGIEGFSGQDFRSSQYFTVVPETQSKTDAVARPVVHLSAYKQATGEAIYCDDMPKFENELYMSLVLSTKAHAKVVSIDTTEAMQMEGVYGFVSAKDLKRNFWGEFKEEKVFYSDEVTSHGQIIAAVLADSQLNAQNASKKVRVTYEELKPVIITIEEAIEHKSFFGDTQRLTRGNVEKVFERSHVIEGQCRVGGQEHFYLETQSVVVVPGKEDDELEIYASTQSTSEVIVRFYFNK